MMHRIFLIFTVLSFSLSVSVSGQLSDGVIDELAENHADRWAEYLNLSKYRKAKLKKAWIGHEKRKSVLLRSASDISKELKSENEKFLGDLSEFITPNELKIYENLERLKLEDDREYLNSLIGALSNDSLFVNAYADLQYNEILPFLVSIRMELEEVISSADRIKIGMIRSEILDLYDKCLVTCLAHQGEHEEILEDLDELIIVALNKDLNDDQSGLSQLINLTQKYEEEIHDIYVKYKSKFEHWDKEERQLKDKYILAAYNKSLIELKKRNGLSTLKHIESDAIFLLIDPYDHNLSRSFLNLGLRNQF